MNIFTVFFIAWQVPVIFPTAVLRAAEAAAVIRGNEEFRPRTGTFQLLGSGTDKDPVVFVWETGDSTDWFKPYTGADACYKDFAGWVRAHLATDPRALLKRNRKLWKKSGGSTKKYDLVLSGKLGRIRPMNRLEAELLLLQLNSFGKPYAGEFLAFVLRKEGRLRIYGYETAKRTIKPGVIRRELKAAIADKWEYYANLHSHPFLFSDDKSSTGELIPSGDATDGDVQFYLADYDNLGLRRAWITNGFDTIEISGKEFSALGAIPGR